MTAQSAFKHALMVSFYASREKEKFFNTTSPIKLLVRVTKVFSMTNTNLK